VIKRLATLIALLLLGTVSSAVPAHAYPPGGPAVGTDRSTYTVGSKVFITAKGFVDCAGKTVVFTIFAPASSERIVVTGIAHEAGVAVVSIPAPEGLGQYTVVASSDGCPTTSTTFIVGRLPQTGSDPQSWVVTAAALLFTGAGLWFVARRRRRTVSAE
jgi:LPXTG-motif cell wall-anchored protein